MANVRKCESVAERMAYIQEAYDGFNRRDLSWTDDLPPDCEVHDPPEVPDAQIRRGPEAIREDWEQMYSLYDEYRLDVEEHFDAGDELVVFVRYWGRGHSSGAEVEARMANIWSFRDGVPFRMRQFLDRGAALEAVGLSSSALSA